MIHRVFNKLSRPALISLAISLGFSTAALAGSLTPPGVVASTMHSLQELYDSIAGTFDSSAIVANENGSLVQHMKFIEENMGTGGSVSSDSLDFDEFVDSMNLDANTSIASHGFTLTTSANVGIASLTPNFPLDVGGDINVSGSYRINSKAILKTPNNNVFLGYNAGSVNTTGSNHIFIGTNAGGNTALEGGATSIGIGSNALYNATGPSAGYWNIAIGSSAAYATTTGIENIAIGRNTFQTNTTGIKNVTVGATAFNQNITGSLNVAIGHDSLTSNQSGSLNVAVGDGTRASGSYNTVLGASATLPVATINSSILIGYNADGTSGHQLVIGSNDVTNGYLSEGFFGSGVSSSAPFDFRLRTTSGLGSNIAGSTLRIAAGQSTGNASGGSIIFQTASSSASSSVTNPLANRLTITPIGNVGIGTITPTARLAVSGTASISGVLYANGGCVGCGVGGSVASNSLDFDEFVDSMNLDANTSIASHGFTLTTSANVGIASLSPNFPLDVGGDINVSGSYRINSTRIVSANISSGGLYLGQGAGAANPTGISNTLIGQNAGAALTTGLGNVIIGAGSGSVMTTGSNHVFIGRNAGGNSTLNSGASSIAIGSNALFNITTGGYWNIGIGESAAYNTTTANSNVAIGRSALFSNTTGQNIAIGPIALTNNTTGTANTVIGASSGGSNITGSQNVLLGGSTNASGSYNIVLGQGSNAGIASSSIVIGNTATGTSSNQLVVGSNASSRYISEGFFGSGVSSSAPFDFRLRTTSGLGNNIAGSNLRIAAGQSTGTANGGSIIFQTAMAGLTGSTTNPLLDRLTITPAGNFGIASSSPGFRLAVEGSFFASSSYGSGLTDCDTEATSKLLWDAATGRFSCGTDQTTGGGAAAGLDVWAPISSLPTVVEGFAGNLAEGRLYMIRTVAPMKLRALGAYVQTAGSGTHEWGLFDGSVNAAAAVKIAGGSGVFTGTGWQTIAATGAPVDVPAGAYFLIFRFPAANTTTLGYGSAPVVGKVGKHIATYTWDDTPDLTTTWSNNPSVFYFALVGDIDGAGNQW